VEERRKRVRNVKSRPSHPLYHLQQQDNSRQGRLISLAAGSVIMGFFVVFGV